MTKRLPFVIIKLMKTRRWNKVDLINAVAAAKSIRQVIKTLGLVPAGGNYDQVQKYIKEYRIKTDHFTGQGWNKGMTGIGKPIWSLEQILIRNSSFQSYKLKQRLLQAGLKNPACEECGWNKKSSTGHLPLELDHINGKHNDNRLENLRILCPNCHSLKPTHRGRNKMKNK